MSVQPDRDVAEDAQPNEPVPDPEGKFGGVPYDWRKPTVKRLQSRWWNSADPRLCTPKTFGWGYDFNLYWVAHFVAYLKHRFSKAR
jgi:hypothetical protein